MSNPAERGANQGDELAENEPIAFKRVTLLKPEGARKYGLNVDKPTFISYTDSPDYRPFVYEVGKVIETDPIPDGVDLTFHGYHDVGRNISTVTSRPRFGLGYDLTKRFVMTNGCEYWGNTRIRSWVAVVEPLGKVVEHEDFLFAYDHVTDKLRVKEIMALCSPQSCRDLPPLREGYAAGPLGLDNYLAICGFDIHPPEPRLEYFKFRIPEGAQPVFEGF